MEQDDRQQWAGVNQQPISVPSDASLPDIYADGVTVQAGYAGFTLIFSKSSSDPAPPVPVGIVRMSPQQALVMTQLLRKILKSYEGDIGKISIPEALFDALEIEKEL